MVGRVDSAHLRRVEDWEDCLAWMPEGSVLVDVLGDVPPSVAARVVEGGPAADIVEIDPVVAALVPALEALSSVPEAGVVCADRGLARRIEARFGLGLGGRTTLTVPSLDQRGPASVRAALAVLSPGRPLSSRLVAELEERPWPGGLDQVAAVLHTLHQACPPGVLHPFLVHARAPEVLAPPPPPMRIEVRRADLLAVWPLDGLGGVIGEGALRHPALPPAVFGAVALRWSRDGLRVHLIDRLPSPWRVEVQASDRGEPVPLLAHSPVTLGTRGEVRLCRPDHHPFALCVVPAADPMAPTQSTLRPPSLPIGDRNVLVEAIIAAADSTGALAEVLPRILLSMGTATADSLAERLGPAPVATLAEWMAADENEALRLSLAERLGRGATGASRHARLPRPLRVWVSWRGEEPQPPSGLRLIVGQDPL